MKNIKMLNYDFLILKKYYFYSIKFADPTGDSGWHTSDELKKLGKIESSKRVYKILDKELKNHNARTYSKEFSCEIRK